MTRSTNDPVLTRSESAAHCGIHVATLDRARKAGEVRCIRRGRNVWHRVSHLEAWLRSHEIGGEA